ncbi:DNA-binding transcriptional regulator, ArsR family [Chitinophaga jiangningensis]|uniref:DNA-binding transcriptional regulator, ArsR family n=1 Tax=Chitinophaga jiangningensis TaxID=1419482 RepID=A0A1M6Y286_9BACT|nr:MULTISPECIES: helix-turn-helix domain-containing protein [Chitinophaga]MBV7529814.1 helix-turn-helix domain-containing protein [Chitinophaga sp. sic0106]SHL12361.1 DNA-binding transcriptional regulator, ArsR family [Chitinophaga jiangningensis]
MDLGLIEKAANAIADKHRLSILMEIAKKGSMACGDMCGLTCLSQPTVSHHVKILVDSGVLNSTKTGRVLELTINKEMMKQLSMFFLKLS